MICDICKQNPATISIKKSFNGIQSQIHICESCAKKEAMMNTGGQFDFSDFIKGILDMQGGTETSAYNFYKNSPGKMNYIQIHCPTCGLTLDEFRKTAKLGCEDCYNAFRNFLEPIIKRMHGRTQHTGKILHSPGYDTTKKRKISDIQQQLDKAISEENYELAAEYRDIIKLLKTDAEKRGSANE